MTNDSKYGRLYPERAVKPLFDLVEGLLVKVSRSYAGSTIGVRSEDLRAALNAHEDNCFPPDEPLLLLRGQDTLAPDTVRYYATRVYNEGAFGGDANNGPVIDHIRAFADLMEQWKPRKLPD